MITLLLATTAPDASSDSISVESALSLLLTGGLLYCLKAIADLRRQLGARPPRAVTAPATAGAAAPGATEVSPLVLAAIAAAVHSALKGRHRVLSVVPATSGVGGWSLEGRREVFHSHLLR